ncbi:MAG TPA: hypothetical protein VHP81_10500 [Lachnospiraceae bacterium]|nr:hypothetical protein [Lachnospiraceae bacterium]
MFTIEDLQKKRKKWSVEDIQRAFGIPTHLEAANFIKECKGKGIFKRVW